VEALLREVVGVVAAFARAFGPADDRCVEAVAHLLLLFVEHLVGRLLPRKPQVAGHGHEPEADRPAGREPEVHIRPRGQAGHGRGDLVVGEVARGPLPSS
jgi:hypothetical protein